MAARSAVTAVVLDTDRSSTVPVRLDGGSVVLDSDAIETALGWHIGENGLCRGDVCLPAKLGAEVSLDQLAALLRRPVAVEIAQLKAAIGDLDKVVRCVRLGGFINATPHFAALPAVMNGASDLMVAVLGDKGRHARTTVGVAELPLDAAVEVEGMFEVS